MKTDNRPCPKCGHVVTPEEEYRQLQESISRGIEKWEKEIAAAKAKERNHAK